MFCAQNSVNYITFGTCPDGHSSWQFCSTSFEASILIERYNDLCSLYEIQGTTCSFTVTV